ncbi:metal-dependent hydrolase [Candidatus Harpocratesius sp.]
MFILTHIFVPLLLIEIFLQKNQEFEENFKRWVIIIGSILPDLIDKPLSLTFPTLFSGRGIAHAPLLWLLIIGILAIIPKTRIFGGSLGYGVFLHLLLDIPHIPWLWPFVPYEIYHSSFQEWLNSLLNNPVIIFSEVISFIGLIVLFKLKKIIFDGKIINAISLKRFLFNHHDDYKAR